MKIALSVAAAMCGLSAPAQNPDLVVNIDCRMQVLAPREGPTVIRFYDNLGRHSVAALKFFTEIGFQGYVSQKLERIPHDADHDELDEYYIEDEGIWRLGKQYLPFGSGRLLHESVPAVRGETQLVIEGLPIVLALCDNGVGRQRGIVGRIGSRLGFSAAIGSHFGINGTSFALVRRPENSPGVGRGYRNVLGVDYSKNAGSLFEFGGELVVLRDGNTGEDRENSIFDLYVTLKAEQRRQVTLGWTRDNAQHADFYRAMGSFFVSRYLTLEPIVRTKGGALYDASITFHFKL